MYYCIYDCKAHNYIYYGVNKGSKLLLLLRTLITNVEVRTRTGQQTMDNILRER